MMKARSLKAILAASVCLLPFQALAEGNDDFDVAEKPASAAQAEAPKNWITIDGQYRSGHSAYLGRFTGALDPGFQGLGSFHLGGRDPWDSGGTHYWELNGIDMGLQSRSFNGKVGEQGSWGLSFLYDSIVYEGADPFRTVWNRYGQLVPGVGPASLTASFGQVLPAAGSVNSLWMLKPTVSPAGLLYNTQIGTQREIIAGTGKVQFGDWTITGSMRHEHKTGYQANSLIIGGAPSVTSAGSGAAAPAANFNTALGYFAQPIDYDTDRYDVTAAWGNERLQAQVGYNFSNFTDNLATFTAQNPFGFSGSGSNSMATLFGGSPANLSAIYVLPPSNSAHQFKLQAGYNFTPTTRLSGNFAYGVQMQNAPYQLGIGNTNVGLGFQTFPRSSFDGLTQTYHGNLTFTARPLDRLDVRLAYTIDDRDNKSPRNLYTNLSWRNRISDASNVDATVANMPFSYEHQTIVAEAGYRILPHTKLTVSDTYESTYRNYTNASLVTSNTITAKVRSMLTDSISGALSYSHQDRDAHNYNSAAWWTLLEPTGSNREPAGFLMYFEASRIHDEVKGSLDVSPTNAITGSLMVKFSNDRYPNSVYGLRNNHNLVVGPDVAWQISPSLSAHAFYSYQQLYYEQASLYETSTTAAINTSATGSGFIVPWTARSTDSVHTLGVTVDWVPIKDVLKFTFDYNLAYGDTAYALGDGGAIFGGAITSPTFQPSITMQPLPDVKSMLNMVSIRGEYTFMPNVTLLFGYAFERFSYKDFMNNAGATQYANALLPGTLNPNDSVHVIGAGIRVRF